jgi:hypothetical protein
VWGSLINLARGIFNTLTAPAAKKPAASPKVNVPPKLAQLPAVNPYIAQWGDSKATIQKGMAANATAQARTTSVVNSNQDALRRQNEEADRKRQEAARKEAARKLAQSKLDTFAGSARNLLQGAVKKAQSLAAKWYKVTHAPDPNKRDVSKMSPQEREAYEFDQVTADYEKRALETLEQQRRKPTSKLGFFDSVIETFGGQTRRESRTRTGAQKQVAYLGTEQIRKYEDKVKWFQTEQGKRIQELEGKKSKGALSQEEIDAYTKWEDSEVYNIRYMDAATKGLLKGYGSGAKAEITTVPGKVGGWFKKNVIDGMPGQVAANFFKYTLGSGGERMPSVVTAPARAMNAANNLFASKQDAIVQKDGTTRTRTGNAWFDSYNQSNLNGSYAKTNYETYVRQKYLQTKRGVNTLPAQFKTGAKSKQVNFDEREFAKWEAANRDSLKKEHEKSQATGQATYNVANDFSLDPLSYLSFGSSTIPKQAGKLSKFVAPVKGSAAKVGGWFENSQNPVIKKATQFGKWLGAEHKDVNARRAEFIQQEIDDIAAKKPLIAKDVAYWNEHKNEIKAVEKAKILQRTAEEYGSLSGADAKTLQRLMRANGDWSAVKHASKYDAGKREYLEMMAVNLRGHLDKLQTREIAAGIATPRRQNYIPQYGRKFGLTVFESKPNKGGEWWFTQEQRTQKIQSKRKLVKSLAAREYYSRLARQDMPVLRKFRAGHEDLGRNVERIMHVKDHVKETKWEKIMRPASVPMKVWKQSVLKYRPSWVVNNVAYNTPAAGLAAGLGGITRQAKLIKNANFQRAIETVPEQVRGKVTNEVGAKGKLSAFYNRVEDIPRLASFQELKSRGFSDDAALKRVNKYLLNYRTRNIERPIKTLVPFYHFQKGVVKAAATMPLDQPLAAKGYNMLDREQQAAFERDFESMRPELKKQGYTDAEIDTFKKENMPFYGGRMKVGDSYITTPFNVFSNNGMSNIGWNPYLAAAGEFAASRDSYGNPIDQKNSFIERLTTKFPQAEIASKAAAAYKLNKGDLRPRKGWIAQPGSLGYGMTKEQQGYDPTATNYRESLDPRAKLGQDVAAYFGKPRDIQFDKQRFLETKKVAKVSKEYFALDRNLSYEERTKQEQALFAKHGMTADEFYNGVLAKNDTEFTKGVKVKRDQARAEYQALNDWYHSLAPGTKNVMATKKLRELVADGYFEKNPFHKYKFDWMTSESVARAEKQLEKIKGGAKWVKVGNNMVLKTQKQLAYEHAKATGDWSAFGDRYGKRTSAKKLAYAKAKASGDWSEYRAAYGDTRKKDTAKQKARAFWIAYGDADKLTRRKMLLDNPEYNTRKDWTDDQWDAEKRSKRAKTLENDRLNRFFKASQSSITSSIPGRRFRYQRRIKYVTK